MLQRVVLMLSQPDSSSVPHVPRVSSALRRALVTAIGTPLIGACGGNPAQPTVLYVAPKLLGWDAAPLLRIQSGGGWLPSFEFRDVQPFGEDMRIILRPKKS